MYTVSTAILPKELIDAIAYLNKWMQENEATHLTLDGLHVEKVK